MPDNRFQKLTDVTLAQARILGADLAGIASWAEVMAGPSYAIQPFMPSWDGVGAGHPGRPPAPDGPVQPQSLVVVGVAHPASRLELDWWRSDIPSRTQGNVILACIANSLVDWLRETHGVMAWDLAYHVERGGVFLKDAAVAAGLGTVGANNLFLAPGLGPRVRLRAVAVAAALTPSPPSGYDLCAGCAMPCRASCPQNALGSPALAPGALEAAGDSAPASLPARDGGYARILCNQQMEADIAAARHVEPREGNRPAREVRYCRRCELTCPAGREE